MNTFSSANRTQIGTGWTGFTIDAVADLYHSGRAGLLVTYPNGNLYYYPNTGQTGMSTFGTPSEVGTGWSSFKVVGLTDLYGTGSDGILTVDTTTGNLSFYPNGGGTGTSTFTAANLVGTGWVGYSTAVGDINGDGKPDVLALDSSGNLWLYPNIGGQDGPGSSDPAFGTQTQVGNGLTNTTLIAATDPYSTGRNGYISLATANGNLYYTPNTGGTGTSTFGTPNLIGTGWTPYTIN